MKSSLIINSIDANNQARQKSFPNINPNATDANVCTFAKKVNALTTNEFVSAIRVDKKPLDDSTPEPVVKQTPTLTLSEFTKDGTTYTATITYTGDGELTTNLGSIDDVTLIVEATETFSGTISAPETDNYLAASVEFRYVIKQTPTLTIGDFKKSGNNLVATITYDGDGTLSTNLGTITDKTLTIPDTEGNPNGTVSASEGENYLAATANFAYGIYIEGYFDNNQLITGTSGNDTVNAGIAGKSNVTIATGAGDDSIYSKPTAYNVLYDGGKGNDTIFVNGAGGTAISVDGGAGDDNIDFYTNAPNSSISGGDGNDTIYANGSGMEPISVFGGAGDDSIKVTYKTTVVGGTGNDTFSVYNPSYNNSALIYNAGDGNDLIQGFGPNNTLKIVGSAFTKSTVGNDVIVNVGSEYITIQGGATVSPLNIVSA